MNKNVKTVLKLLALMVPAGIVGAFLMIGLLRVGETQFFQQIGSSVETFEELSWTIHLGLSVVFLTLITITFLYSKARLPRLLVEEDNEQLDQEFESTLGLSMVLNGVFSIINFLFFTIAAYDANERLPLSILIFIVSFLVSLGFEIGSVRLYQKKDPAKRGDPTSTKFATQWFQSCDEAEKLMIYQAAHQSFRWTSVAFIFANVVVVFFRLAFGIFGLGTILVLGTLWMIHLLGYHLHWMKLKKIKISRFIEQVVE